MDKIYLNKMKSYIPVVLILVVLVINAGLYAEECNDDISQEEDGVVYPYYKLMIDTLMSSYSNYISPVNQSSCPMHPTCSGYAEECFRIYNPVMACLKTSDRLIRCTNDLHNYDTINVNGMIRYYDPVVTGVQQLQSIPIGKINLQSEESIEDQDPTNSGESLYWFAKKLEVNKEYGNAIIEYKRLISYYPNSVYIPKAKCDVFNIFFNTGRYLDAINWGKEILNNKDYIDEGNIIYYISLGYFMIGNYNLSRDFIVKTRKHIISDELRDKTILLEGLSFVYEEEWEQAEALFADISQTSNYYKLALQFIDLSQQGARLKKKNPKTAAALSVIPGLGYMYCGYQKTAFSSFLVNGLLMWGTHSAFDDDNRGFGIFLGGISLSLYAGNIYGPYQTAIKKNDEIVKEHIEKFSLDFLN